MLLQPHRNGLFSVGLSLVCGFSMFMLACLGERVRTAKGAPETASVTARPVAPASAEQGLVVIPEDPVLARQLTAQVDLATQAGITHTYLVSSVEHAMRGLNQFAPRAEWNWAEAAAIRGAEFVSLVKGVGQSRQTFLPIASAWSEQMDGAMANVTAALSASVGADVAVTADRMSIKKSQPVTVVLPNDEQNPAAASPPTVAPATAATSVPGGMTNSVNLAALPRVEPVSSAVVSPSVWSASAVTAYEDQELDKIAASSRWSREELELIYQDTIDVARADDPEATAKENASYALCMLAALAKRSGFAAFNQARDQGYDALERDGTRGLCTAQALADGSDHIDARSNVGKWTKRQLAWMTNRCARDAARAYSSTPEAEHKTCDCLHNALTTRMPFGELMQLDDQGFIRLIERDAQLATCL